MVGNLCHVFGMGRPSMFEFAGGEPAFLALATAHHERCLQDPVLNHPFSHPGHPQHVEIAGGGAASAMARAMDGVKARPAPMPKRSWGIASSTVS